MEKKPFWDKPNPKDKPKKMSAAQKLKAKKFAKDRGMAYPSLVANVNAMKGKK
jgi:hypothetical protein